MATRPCATFSEVAADIQALQTRGSEGIWTIRKTSPIHRFAKVTIDRRLAEYYALRLWQMVERGLAIRVEARRPKAKRTDALHNEYRMRAALLTAVKANGWTGLGVRELARRAGLPHRTARDTLGRMVASGQVQLDKREGKPGNRHGFRVLLDHPCWSEPKTAHLLAQSNLSSLVTL